MVNTINLRIKILEEKDNKIIAQVIKKELLTCPDPKEGQIYTFIGNYDSGIFKPNQTAIVASGFVPPNLRKDPSQLEMTIEKIEPDHFDPGGADLDITLLTVIFSVILLGVFVNKFFVKSIKH